MKLKILSCFLVLLNLSVFSQKTENYRLSPEEFAIMPWGSTTGELSVLKDIYECGFNLAGFVDIGDLQNVSLAGLKAIVYDEAIRVCDPDQNTALMKSMIK